MILDDLVAEGFSKKVTVGVAEDADAAILTRKINGLFWNGQHLYVEDVRQQKVSFFLLFLCNLVQSLYCADYEVTIMSHY